MKTKLIFSLMMMVALSAQAGHEGPQAAPTMPPSPVLAELVIAQGFMFPPNAARSKSLQVLASGQVQLVSSYKNYNEVQPIEVLGAADLAVLMAQVATVQPGELVDTNPHGPICEDGATSNYIVHNGSPESILIEQVFGCKTSQKANNSAAEQGIEATLDRLLKLTYNR